jgi:hypothetical protein
MPNRSFLSTRHDRILNIRSPQALRNEGDATITIKKIKKDIEKKAKSEREEFG